MIHTPLISKSFALQLLFVLLWAVSSCKTQKTNVNPDNNTANTPSDGLTEREQIDFSYLFFEANKEKILGNYNPAIQKFNQAMRINPRNAAVHYELSQLYLRVGMGDQAEISGQQALRFDPKNKWYLLSLAEVYELRGKNDKLLPLLKTLAETEPANPEYQYNLATAYELNRKFPEAIAVYDKLEKQYGLTEELALQKKKLYMQMDKPEKAVEEIQRLMKAFPDEIGYRGFLAEIYQATGQKEKAIAELEEIVRLDPDNPNVYFSLAEFYRQEGNNEKSFEALKKAVGNPDAELDLKFQLLSSYFDLSQQFPELVPQALELCSLVVESHPESARARAAFGDFLYRENKLGEAAAQYEQVLQLDPSVFGVWNQLLMIASEQKEFEKMRDKSKQAIELFPTSPVFFLYSGVANIQLKAYDKAVEDLKTGADMTVDNPALSAQFYSSMGDTYNALKKHAESDQAYEKALEFDARNVYVMNNYAYYLSLRKVNLDRALELSSRANELQPANSSFLDTKAWVLYQRGEFEQAEIWIDKALDSGGMRSATIVEHKGDILWKRGRKADALDFWKRAKELGGGSDQLEKKINTESLIE